jgi:hypothetical protein
MPHSRLLLLTLAREFLTGFHKRKVAKAETARKKAQEREKQDRLEARREVVVFLIPFYLSLISLLCSNAEHFANRPPRMFEESKARTSTFTVHNILIPSLKSI